MAYDDKAKAVAVHAIGTVESSMKYDAIYYVDPITVGLVQWYGPRAANILHRMQKENPSAWTGVARSLQRDLDAHGNTQWWTGRYLTRDEGASIKPVLRANKKIQNDQVVKDLEDYVDLAERWGMDKDTNTNAMIFWFVAYHQSPKRARNILNSAGPSSSMARLRSFILNEPVLKKYKTRYNSAYDIISRGDTGGVDFTSSDPAPDPGPGDPDEGDEGNANEPSDSGGTRGQGDVMMLQQSGDMIMVIMRDGRRLPALPNGSGMFIVSQDHEAGTDVIVDPTPDNGENGEGETAPTDPEVTPGAGMSVEGARKAAQIIAWTKSKISQYRYSQGPGRLNPEKSGATDCSGLLRTAYLKFTNIDPGTYTGAMRGKGKLILGVSSGRVDESKLWPGDLFLMHHKNGVSHVEMYIGGGKVIGHGGVPFMGPTIKGLQEVALRQRDWEFRRHLK